MDKPIRIVSRASKRIYTDAIPGHFATNHSHTNYYIDTAHLRHSNKMAYEAAQVIAAQYANLAIDTIVCLEDTKMIGAYLALELTREGLHSLNSGKEIFVVEPVSNVNGKYIFADNLVPMVRGRNVLIMAATAATGGTLSDARECVEYYGGTVAAYTALLSNVPEMQGLPIVHLFSSAELPHYHNYAGGQGCADCMAGRPLDAIVTPHGYQKL